MAKIGLDFATYTYKFEKWCILKLQGICSRFQNVSNVVPTCVLVSTMSANYFFIIFLKYAFYYLFYIGISYDQFLYDNTWTKISPFS